MAHMVLVSSASGFGFGNWDLGFRFWRLGFKVLGRGCGKLMYHNGNAGIT